MDHRGRLQAQGKNLEESESWSQPDPLYSNEAKFKLTALEERLSSAERKKRQKAFSQCKAFIVRACEAGDILVIDKALRKSFPGTNMERVDIEVLKGKAFLRKDDGTC